EVVAVLVVAVVANVVADVVEERRRLKEQPVARAERVHASQIVEELGREARDRLGVALVERVPLAQTPARGEDARRLPGRAPQADLLAAGLPGVALLEPRPWDEHGARPERLRRLEEDRRRRDDRVRAIRAKIEGGAALVGGHRRELADERLHRRNVD